MEHLNYCRQLSKQLTDQIAMPSLSEVKRIAATHVLDLCVASQKFILPDGGFHEGDHVTRDGSDVHLVKDMTADGFAATFVCVVAPAAGWTAVGEEESNVCRRYERVTQDEQTGQWKITPGERQQYRDPEAMMRSAASALARALIDSIAPAMTELAKSLAAGTIGGGSFARAWLTKTRRPKSRQLYRRNPKRRALRK